MVDGEQLVPFSAEKGTGRDTLASLVSDFCR
jgi:hypothetical protein